MKNSDFNVNHTIYKSRNRSSILKEVDNQLENPNMNDIDVMVGKKYSVNSYFFSIHHLEYKNCTLSFYTSKTTDNKIDSISLLYIDYKRYLIFNTSDYEDLKKELEYLIHNSLINSQEYLESVLSKFKYT